MRPILGTRKAFHEDAPFSPICWVYDHTTIRQMLYTDVDTEAAGFLHSQSTSVASGRHGPAEWVLWSSSHPTFSAQNPPKKAMDVYLITTLYVKDLEKATSE